MKKVIVLGNNIPEIGLSVLKEKFGMDNLVIIDDKKINNNLLEEIETMRNKKVALLLGAALHLTCTEKFEIELTIERQHSHYSPIRSRTRYGKGDRAKNKKSFNNCKNGKKF